MEKRLLGRTGHHSTVVTFGAIVVGRNEMGQDRADELIELVLEHGINHFDVAPTYGKAMERLAPWMPRIRDDIFLGAKTGVRDRDGAWESIRSCMSRLDVDRFDLFQLHGVGTMEHLDEVTRTGGALNAIVEARDRGVTGHIGITGHGPEAPRVHLEALRRFDFDTVMFPVSAAIWRNGEYRRDTEALMAEAAARDVGIQCIKMLARGGWGDGDRECATWYDPHREQSDIDEALWWLLSQPIHTAPSTGEAAVLAKILDAAHRGRPAAAHGRAGARHPSRRVKALSSRRFEPVRRARPSIRAARSSGATRGERVVRVEDEDGLPPAEALRPGIGIRRVIDPNRLQSAYRRPRRMAGRGRVPNPPLRNGPRDIGVVQRSPGAGMHGVEGR